MWQFWRHALCMTQTVRQNWGWHKIARPGTCRKLKDKEDRTFTASILQSEWWQQFCWPCDLEDKAGLAPSALDEVLEMCIVVLPTDIMHFIIICHAPCPMSRFGKPWSVLKATATCSASAQKSSSTCQRQHWFGDGMPDPSDWTGRVLT